MLFVSILNVFLGYSGKYTANECPYPLDPPSELQEGHGAPPPSLRPCVHAPAMPEKKNSSVTFL